MVVFGLFWKLALSHKTTLKFLFLFSAETYALKGYVHYHELVSVDSGTLHPSKVVWLKHIARTSFTLDGGPHPEFAHYVTPGIDYEFILKGLTPYPSDG